MAIYLLLCFEWAGCMWPSGQKGLVSHVAGSFPTAAGMENLSQPESCVPWWVNFQGMLEVNLGIPTELTLSRAGYLPTMQKFRVSTQAFLNFQLRHGRGIAADHIMHRMHS